MADLLGSAGILLLGGCGTWMGLDRMNAIAERSPELNEIEHQLEPSAHRENVCSVPPISQTGRHWFLDN